jgi:phosphoribosylaminoimidazole (AIR) synthetase
MSQSLYEQLGVDPHKAGVRRAFGGVISNDFPGAFCNIVHDPSVSGQVVVKHPDGDGSKFMQRCLHFSETSDQRVFRGAVDDALSMNTGDIAAAGFVGGDLFLTDIIAINGFNVRKDIVMQQLSGRIAELLKLYHDFGFSMIFMGGETADLPGQVDSIVFDMDIFARAPAEDVIAGNIQPGDAIFGFSSTGQAKWENGENSGIMSNGLTLARTALMHENYSQKYPFLSQTGKGYRGRFHVGEVYSGSLIDGVNVGEALISPTRQWAIVIRLLIMELKKLNALDKLHGISMNTGGGATKVGNLGHNILYCKNMPWPPPIFILIQQESRENWRNMFVTFNCGVGIDIIGDNGDGAFEKALIETSQITRLKYLNLGYCKKSPCNDNEIQLHTPVGEFFYPEK